MKVFCALMGLILAGLAAPVRAEPLAPAVTSNDVERISRETAKANQEMKEQIRVLEGKVAKMSETMGDRRGAERFDSMSEELRDVKRRLDRIERDISQLQQAIRRVVK